MTAPITRSTLADIVAYQPDETPIAIDLSDNTNRFGAPPAAVRELSGAASTLARYPSCYSTPLRDALAAYMGVDASNIIVGAGSDNVLDAAIRAFGEPDDVLAFVRPTFQMVPVFARVNGLRVASVAFDAAGDVDVDALLADDPRLVYVCSPNNPTGLAIPRATLERIVARAHGVVIVDEAYAEFSGTSVVDLVASAPRLLVVRTLSKAWGLAGLRTGYGIAQPSIIEAIEKSRGPFTVAGPSERAAAAAVIENVQWMRDHAALAVANRDRFIAALRDLGFAPLPSAANFVFVPIFDARGAAAAAHERGVAIRVFEALDFPNDALRAAGGNGVRISIGQWDEVETLLAALGDWKTSCA
jgi:histidinol-phosphate aminotransferase